MKAELWLLAFLLPYCLGYTFSALRMITDVLETDISIKALYNETTNSSLYVLILSTTIIQDYGDLSMCFRKVTVTDTSDTECTLIESSNFFNCLTYHNSSSISMYILSSDYTYKAIQNTWASLVATVGKKSIQIDLNSNFLSTKGFYQMRTVSDTQFYATASEIKKNYLNTFSGTDPSSDDLIMQRNWYCSKYLTFYSLIFYGGVIRSGSNYFMMAVVAYEKSGAAFQMWGGISYCQDKVSRDMMGFSSFDSNIYDLYSLYASAPFLDTSINVGGTDDLEAISISSQPKTESYLKYQSYHMVYRQYDTGDAIGDQIIQNKIQNKYCYVAYYKATPTEDDIDTGITPVSLNFQHQVVTCFLPDISLREQFKTVIISLILVVMIAVS